jgi:hypothetical protein
LIPPLLAGAFSALAHLTRADGILLLLVGYAVIFYPFGWIIGKRGRAENRQPVGARHASPLRAQTPGDDNAPERARYTVSLRILQALAMTLAYLLVMLPWFLRNIEATGAPLPIGGAQAIWFTSYDDLFSYPPDASAANFFAENAIQRLIETRWLALTNNLGTFIAVEGWVVLAPFMLIGLWRRRRDPFWRGFWIYALGVHLAMTFVFPFPGYRGGLFHSAAALIPFWAVLGLLGLDDVVEWAAKRRRWRADTAKAVFSAALFGFALYLSVSTALNGRVGTGAPLQYAALARQLPASARVMLNDPAALYYFTGLSGVVLPNETPDVISDIARRYAITHLLLEAPDGTPRPLWSLFEVTPDFLREVPFGVPGVRLFEINVESIE